MSALGYGLVFGGFALFAFGIAVRSVRLINVAGGGIFLGLLVIVATGEPSA